MSDDRLVVVGTAAVMGAGSRSALAAQAHDRRWVRKPKSTHLLLCWQGTMGQKKCCLGRTDVRLWMRRQRASDITKLCLSLLWPTLSMLSPCFRSIRSSRGLFVCCWSVSRPALRWLLLAHHRQQLPLLLVCLRPASVLSVSPEWSSS